MIIELEYAINSSKGGIMDEPSSGGKTKGPHLKF